MSERYTRLFSLQKNLYTYSSPVTIAAGALLKDNSTNQMLVQLKFQNISNKVIKAIKVNLVLMDTLGNILSENTEHQYLDTDLHRNNYFGQKNPIILSFNTTRSFSVCVTEVIFKDNTVWTCDTKQWESLKTQDRLEIGLGNDSNLVEQYKIKYGEKCKYIPLKEKDVWICTCGTINHSDEKKCCNCNNDAQTIFSVNLDELKAECNERIAQENKEKKREIQTEIVFVIGICICIVCVLCFLAKIN